MHDGSKGGQGTMYYTIVVDDSVDGLCIEVNQRLSEGERLCGGVAVVPMPSGRLVYFQAMTSTTVVNMA
jgi:hypothetical protein